jgi:glycosyltransferase involved in cell wall biosynthesis
MQDAAYQTPTVNVIQDGARLHYALPIALQRQGILGTVFTDWLVRSGSREEIAAHWIQRVSPDLGKRLAHRRCPELESSRVISSNRVAIHHWLARAYPGPPENRYAHLSKSVARWVVRQDWRGANAMAGFVRNIDPMLCAAARQRGLVTVVDQMIAPAAIEVAEADLQATRWPQWRERRDPGNLDIVRDIERRTWALADHITCPSEYVREGLLQQGITPDRVSVIPYPIDVEQFRSVDRRGRDGPLMVGFVGAVGMRKGAPTFIEVARSFAHSEARFVMVGPVELEGGILAAHQGRVELAGAVPRSQVFGWLEQFDVFLFPSTCEGSAGAVMEAMATGLPVITTPNSGTVVRDGIDGFIRAWDDIAGFVKGVARLRDDPALRLCMGAAACERARNFDLDSYGRSFDRLFRQLIIQQSSCGSTGRQLRCEGLWPRCQKLHH